jgi:N utilization substance protein A
MARRITDEARRCIALFEDETGAAATDCVIDDAHDRVLVLVAPGEMAQAIGPDGQNVDRVERRLDRTVSLVEDADDPAAFVANALAPAVVHNVTISEVGDGDRVAYAEVDEADRGVAIGADGRTIEAARTLARRRFDITDVELV